MAAAFGHDDFGLYTSTIPDLHYASTAIYLYAKLEQQFNEACMIVKNVKGMDLRPDAFAGQGVTRAKLYLEDYAGLKIDLSEEDWRHITEIAKIRNCLVHGAFSPDNPTLKKLQGYCAQTKAFDIGQTQLLISRKTVDHILERLSHALDRLGAAVYVLGNDAKYRAKF